MRITEKIYAFLKRDKLTLNDFSKKTGVSRTKLWRVHTGQGSFDDKEILKLSAAFKVTSDYLLAADYFPPRPEDKLSASRNVRPKQPEEIHETPDTLPIIGHISAGETEVTFEDTGYPSDYSIDEIRRPDGVIDPHAYALYIEGGSMAPFLPEGSLVVAVTNVPTKAGDIVICREKTTRKVYIKHLRRDDGIMVLESFNTQHHDPLMFKKEDISFLHPCVWFKRAR
ncbi:MAG: LexA family transcriptional regulator [Candidatus Bathyanammoxibius sp.]